MGSKSEHLKSNTILNPKSFYVLILNGSVFKCLEPAVNSVIALLLRYGSERSKTEFFIMAVSLDHFTLTFVFS